MYLDLASSVQSYTPDLTQPKVFSGEMEINPFDPRDVNILAHKNHMTYEPDLQDDPSQDPSQQPAPGRAALSGPPISIVKFRCVLMCHRFSQ